MVRHEICPVRQFSDGLRLGESGNGWLQAQRAVGTGEAGCNRPWHPGGRHLPGKISCGQFQCNGMANLANNTRLARRSVRRRTRPSTGMGGAIACGRERGGLLRQMVMREIRCRVSMCACGAGTDRLHQRSRSGHTRRHRITDPAAYWQQNDHDGNKQQTHL